MFGCIAVVLLMKKKEYGKKDVVAVAVAETATAQAQAQATQMKQTMMIHDINATLSDWTAVYPKNPAVSENLLAAE